MPLQVAIDGQLQPEPTAVPDRFNPDLHLDQENRAAQLFGDG